MNNSSASSHAIPNILAAEMNCTACHQPSPVDLKECGISSPSAASERGFQINELTENMPSCCNKYEIPIVICVTSPVTDEKMSENHYKIAENFSPTFSCNNGFSADNNDVVSVTNNAAIPVDRSGVMSIAINGTSKIDNSDSALADNNHTVLVAPSETKSNDHSSGLCSDFPLVYCSSSIFRPNVLQVSESRQQFIGPDEDSNSVMAGMNGLGVTPGAQDGIVILFPNRLSLTRQLSVRSIKERWWQIGVQVVIPLMFAGFGMVAAGIVLDIVQVCLLVVLCSIQAFICLTNITFVDIVRECHLVLCIIHISFVWHCAHMSSCCFTYSHMSFVKHCVGMSSCCFKDHSGVPFI